MKEKIHNLLGSIRFWIITFAAASATAAWIETHGFKVSELLNAISLYLGTVAGVGTLDSIAQKLNPSNEPNKTIQTES